MKSCLEIDRDCTFIPCMLKSALYGVQGSRQDFAKIFPLRAPITCMIGLPRRKIQLSHRIQLKTRKNGPKRFPPKKLSLIWDSLTQTDPFYLFRGCHSAEGAHQLADVRLSEQLVLNYIAKAAVLCFFKTKTRASHSPGKIEGWEG